MFTCKMNSHFTIYRRTRSVFLSSPVLVRAVHSSFCFIFLMTLSNTDQSTYIRTLILMSIISPQDFQIVMIKLSVKVKPTALQLDLCVLHFMFV